VPRRAIATGIAVAIAVMAALLTPTTAAATSGLEILKRAQSWATAGVGYSGSNYHTNEYGTYRTDCSGYVSMAWGLGSSYTTVTLPDVSYPIAKDALEPGDILNNPLPGTSGHVVLFAGWADDARTRYFAYEQSPSGGAQLNEIPYPYWPGYGVFTPRRYVGTTSKSAPPLTIPEPEAPEPAGPEPLTDGDFVRHDKQVYRIAGGAPLAVTSWQNLGGRERTRKLTDAEFAALAAQPADGTFLRTPRAPLGRGETYVVAGGAPVFVPRGALDPKDVVTVDQAAIDDAGTGGPLDRLNNQPADGTIARTDSGERYVFAGGAPIHISDGWWKALRPKPSVTTVAQEALDQAGGLGAWSHVRNFPADDTLLKVGADVYRIERGVPMPHYGVRGVPIDPAAIDNAGGAGPWSHLVAAR
jgi:hypothetical protein